MKLSLKILSIIVSIVMISCDRKTTIESQIIDNNLLEESLINNNIQMLSQESKLIDEYVKQNDLNVIRTGTGLRYHIINLGEGDFIKKGDVITLQYEISLLNGNVIYSSENEGNKTFVVGRGGVESGLEEAVLKLKRNSEAILILPSHLAHGFVGDGNKISYRNVLIYKVKIIDINN